jgi:hypothetical protein
MAKGQLFGQLMNYLAKTGKVAGPMLQKAAMPVAVAGGTALALGGLAKLGQAGVDVVQGDRAATGSSPLGGRGPGMSNEDNIELLSKVMGLNVEQTREMLPLINQLNDENLRRGMEATRQVGQIQGDLSRQKYGYQLAGGAQQLGLGTLQTLMSNPNPYAQTGLTGVSSLSL